MRIRPFVGINAIYDTGLTAIATDAEGNLRNQNLYGGVLNFGAVGSRAYRRSLLNLSYMGSLRHYPNSTFLTGTNHMANVGFSHMFSRRLSLNSVNQARVLSNAFMGNFGTANVDVPDDNGVEDDVFNNPVISLSTNQMLTYQKSLRVSLTGGGGAFNVSRRSNALISMYGVNAMGSIGYRLGPRKTIGVNYGFNQFFFDNRFGGTNIHTIGTEYAHQFTKRTQVSLNAGGARVESQSLQRVALDPILAALLGTPFGVEATYRRNYLPVMGVRLQHQERSWSFAADARRSVNPGNGLMLTNSRTNANATVLYSGIRKWTFQAGGGYSKMAALLGNVRSFESYQARVGFTYQLARGLSWTAGVSARQFSVGRVEVQTNPFFDRTQYRFQTGLRWSPSEVPVPFF